MLSFYFHSTAKFPPLTILKFTDTEKFYPLSRILRQVGSDLIIKIFEFQNRAVLVFWRNRAMSKLSKKTHPARELFSF